MSFTPIEITGTYSNPDGSACSGFVTFILSTPIANSNVVIQPQPIICELGTGGTLATTLYANNDPGTIPNVSNYVVVEQTDGAANREYTIKVPYDAPGGTADISTLNTDISAMPIFDGEGTDQFISFITPADLMDWLQIPAGSMTSPQVVTNMQRVTDMASTWVQRYCGRPLCPTMYSERHDGWSGSDIQLKKDPVLDPILVTEYQSSGGLIVLVEATPNSNNNDANVFQLDRAVGTITRAFGGYSWPRTWFPGRRNVSVTYLAGYSPIPPEVWMATIELASYWYRMTQQTRRDSVRGGSDPDQLDTANGLWSGVPYRITAMIDAFRLVAIG